MSGCAKIGVRGRAGVSGDEFIRILDSDGYGPSARPVTR